LQLICLEKEEERMDKMRDFVVLAASLLGKAGKRKGISIVRAGK